MLSASRHGDEGWGARVGEVELVGGWWGGGLSGWMDGWDGGRVFGG